MPTTVRVWDLPTRVFHWTQAACVIGLVITGQFGGAAMAWHFRLGYAVLALLLFRLLWGFVGGHWSRFAVFVPTPAGFWNYLRGRTDTQAMVGHNPLGALSVLAMLFFLLAQVGTGLVSDDEIANSGPLVRFVSGTLVSQATSYHKQFGKMALIVLVLLHLAAIAFYRLRHRDNLVRPMLLGDKEWPVPQPSARDDARSRTLALMLLGLCSASVAALLQWAG